MKTRKINLSRRVACCQRCGHEGRRHSTVKRRLAEIGISQAVWLEVTYSRHYCTTCRKHFSIDMSHLAVSSGRYTNRVRRVAVGLIHKNCMTLEQAGRAMRHKYHVEVPATTMHDWVLRDVDDLAERYTAKAE